jgi:hypothetical protein
LKDSTRKRRVLRNDKERAKMLHHSVCIGTFTKDDDDVDNSFVLIKEAAKKVENSPRIRHQPNMTGSEVQSKGRLKLYATHGLATEVAGMD